MFNFINFIDFYKYLPILNLMPATQFKQVETGATKDTCLKQLTDKKVMESWENECLFSTSIVSYNDFLVQLSPTEICIHFYS